MLLWPVAVVPVVATYRSHTPHRGVTISEILGQNQGGRQVSRKPRSQNPNFGQRRKHTAYHDGFQSGLRELGYVEGGD